MAISAETNSLPRRLANLHLLGGLICLLIGAVCALLPGIRGSSLESALVTYVLPVALLLVGAALIRRTSNVHAAIEQQLRQFAFSPIGDSALQPLSETEPLGVGWNGLIERLSGRTALDRIGNRLEAQRGHGDSSLSQALDCLPEGIAVTNAAGELLLANRTLKALIGLPLDTGDGNNLVQALAQLVPDQAETVQQRLTSPRRAVVFELMLGEGLADGVLRIARYPVQGSEQQTDTQIWSIRDITQHKLAEELRSQFVFTVTHELRTPLTNIKAYAETLAAHEDIDVEQQKQFYNTINSEATRLARFVDELLNVSQMESGALTLNRHETEILRLVEEVVEHVRPEFTRKKIHFEKNLPVKLPKLHVDKDKVTSALVNLLGNAGKYTPEGGRVRLTLEAHPHELLFHIEDTGFGIAAEEIPKLFEKFFRSHDVRVQDISGSGLGLAFTHEVARLHGGSLKVHSELNRGSCFTMALPINPDRDRA